MWISLLSIPFSLELSLSPMNVPVDTFVEGGCMNELNMIWDEVVSILSLDLNDIQLQNWILPLKPISLEKDLLIIDAKSAFIRNMVQKHYADLIVKSVSYICDKEIRIELTDPGKPDYYVNVDRKKPTKIEQLVITRIEEKNQKKEEEQSTNGYRTLNPKYTLDNFVRGKSNEFAFATAKAVISNPGYAYNPLFIYGLSGLGKTHLMQAIAHEILIQDPTKRVLYITSEKFMNEMIAMIENGTNAEKERFRTKYRSIDVLLIDDIQFIAGKKATMEEIFHTFNDLKEANKQIILSSDKPPKELKNLEERLVTRFEGGMTADIQSPDFETRVAIVRHKMKRESFLLTSDIVDYIATNVTSNIRELEGALLRVIAFFKLKGKDPMEESADENMIVAREALRLEETRDVPITIEDILRHITQKYNLESRDLLSKSRQASIVAPRQIAMYLSRKLTNLSLMDIGRSFQRDHTTVIHAVDKIERSVQEDEEFKTQIQSLINDLRENGG